VRAKRQPRPAGKLPVLKADMPYSKQVRIKAKHLAHAATGSMDAWRTYKAAAEKALKGAA